MNLRQLLDHAEVQVNKYKYPDISEFRAAINPILEAADLGSTGNDEITSIDEYGDSIRITTIWYCRGCDQSSDFNLPSFIIDSENPIKAAKIWATEKKLKDELSYFNQHLTAAKRSRKSIKELTIQLGELK